MRIAALTLVLLPSLAWAQAAVYPVGNGRPSVAEARKEMGIPSTDEVRGQLDNVGYASKPEAMAKVWELAAQPPEPESLGALPKPGVAALIGPHDDYVYAARVDRRIYPLVTAKTVVLVGVFHRYRRFGAHDQMIFDSYRRWRAPDGEVTVSPLRDELAAALPAGEAVKDGPADRSFGLQVAALAGLPRTVVRQARARLAELEQQGRDAPSTPMTAQALDAPQQIGLFAPSSAALEALSTIEPDELTPRQALEALYRLKSMA